MSLIRAKTSLLPCYLDNVTGKFFTGIDLLTRVMRRGGRHHRPPSLRLICCRSGQ
ncbi:hypothetical protein [Hafnia psychrotolerans]|uniref:hypothetical protein n=1 Tax=Hafnia psychrotolerans TaxID=1477018 RepID=UPI0016664401|nr:hypothetical protein [Hafnia psychrotolerans]